MAINDILRNIKVWVGNGMITVNIIINLEKLFYDVI